MSLTDLTPLPTADAADRPDTAPGSPADAGPTIDLTASSASPARPQFTITEAATACAVSRKTITRKLADLAEHGAAKDVDGVWRIPVEALLAVGLHPGRSLPEHRESQARARDTAASPSQAGQPAPAAPVASSREDVVTVPRDRWDDLRIRLARAEAEAAERALALADARLALRALTAGPTAGPTPSPSTEPWPVETVAVGPEVTPAAAVALPPAELPAPGGDPLAAARSQAAQTGGYVSAEGLPRRRRWWQSQKG
jgi:hypothetical protein